MQKHWTNGAEGTMGGRAYDFMRKWRVSESWMFRDNRSGRTHFKRGNKYFRCECRNKQTTSEPNPTNKAYAFCPTMAMLIWFLFPFPRIWIHWSKQQKYIRFNTKTMYNFPFLAIVWKWSERTHKNGVSFQLHDSVYCECGMWDVQNALLRLFSRTQFSLDESAFKCTQMINFNQKNIQCIPLTTVFPKFLLFFPSLRTHTIGLRPHLILKTKIYVQMVESVPFFPMNCRH